MGTIGELLHQLLYCIVIVYNRILAALSHDKQLHKARFARIDELTSLLSTKLDRETSLLLGVSRFNRILRVQSQQTRRELGNLLIVAPTRGGKGLLATSQLLTWPHSVVVNDIKGELFHQTAGYRSTLGPVFVIDPTGVGHRYDPLIGKHTEDELLSVATQLLFKANEGDGAVFTKRAIGMLRELFLAARVEGVPPLPYVRQIIRKGPAKAAARLYTIDPELATRFLYQEYEEFSRAKLQDRFLHSAWGTLWADMEALLTETVVRCFTGTDFTARELMCSDKPITVYLRWTERDLLALAPLVKLLWGSLIDELLTTYDTTHGENCNPVLLLIDEAGRTAIPHLADHATTVVGRRVYLWIAIQSLSQLDVVYGEGNAQILRDNMDSQLYYRPANQKTADYLEHCLGKKSDYAQSQTKREDGEVSEGESEQGVPLMTAQDIKLLDDDDIIGFHRKLRPFQAKRMDWQHFPLLKQRHNLQTPALAALPSLADSLSSTIWQKPTLVADGYIDPDM